MNNYGSVDFKNLYMEYLKALNLISHKTVKPIPFKLFQTTMPFVFLRPWSNSNSHLSREGRDLIIKIKSPISESSKIAVILFRLMVMQIAPDGSVSLNY